MKSQIQIFNSTFIYLLRNFIYLFYLAACWLGFTGRGVRKSWNHVEKKMLIFTLSDNFLHQISFFFSFFKLKTLISILHQRIMDHVWGPSVSLQGPPGPHRSWTRPWSGVLEQNRLIKALLHMRPLIHPDALQLRVCVITETFITFIIFSHTELSPAVRVHAGPAAVSGIPKHQTLTRTLGSDRLRIRVELKRSEVSLKLDVQTFRIDVFAAFYFFIF